KCHHMNERVLGTPRPAQETVNGSASSDESGLFQQAVERLLQKYLPLQRRWPSDPPRLQYGLALALPRVDLQVAPTEGRAQNPEYHSHVGSVQSQRDQHQQKPRLRQDHRQL